MTFDEATAMLQAVEARIAARKLLEAEEPDEQEAETVEEPVEFLVAQRRCFDAARQRAINTLPPAYTFGNPRDFETHVQMRMSQETGMTFSNVTFFGAKPDTVDKLAQGYVDLADGARNNSRLVDSLRDEIHDLKLQLVREKGGRG